MLLATHTPLPPTSSLSAPRRKSHSSFSIQSSNSKKLQVLSISPSLQSIPITSRLLKYYAQIASNLALNGRLNEFLSIAEGILVSDAINAAESSRFIDQIELKRVSGGIAVWIGDGRVDDVVDFLCRLEKIGIRPLYVLGGSAIKGECGRLMRQRVDSWDNYCSLFSVVLHGVVNMQLPILWLWDMVDEFIYQFHSYCQYRAKLKNKTEELQLLRQYDQAWNVYGVLNYLQALVEKSMISQILEREKEGLEQFTATDGYDYEGGSNVLKMLGYYSMIGLLRVHCLLGDYHTGLKCLAPIDISQQGVYISVIGSHIFTIYHYGFANLMLRRYVEATREFNKILIYILKFKQYHQKSPQFDQILKKNEQMYALLAICLSLCPQTKLIEESVSAQLKEKYNDKMLKMQRFDDEAYAVFNELFSYACPKFITPSTPSLEEPLINYNQSLKRRMMLFC